MITLKAGDQAVAEITVLDPHGSFLYVKGTDGRNYTVCTAALHPLPDAPLPASVEAVLAAREQERIFRERPRDFYLADVAAEATNAAIRAHQETMMEKPHPTCDHPALYDAGQCCGKTPCAVARPVGAPCLATADLPALERAVAETADKCVTADGVLYVRGTLFDGTHLAKAVMALRAARKSPDPVADVTKLLTAILKRADKSHTGCNPQLLGDDVSALARAALAAMLGAQ